MTLVVLTLIACSIVVPAAQTVPATPLTGGDRFVQQLEAGGQHVFEIRAAAGDVVRLRIDERGIDVRAEVVAPAGAIMLTTHTNDRTFGTEIVTFVASAEGVHRITVTPADATLPAGRIDVRLEDLHPATAIDMQRVAAMRTLEAAAQHKAASVAAPSVGSQAILLATLEGARDQFAAADDAWGQARAWHELALGYVAAERWDDLAPALREATRRWTTLGDSYALAVMRNVTALALVRSGKNVEALPAFREAYAMAMAGGDLPTASTISNNLAIQLDVLGNPEAAYDAFRTSLDLRRKAGRGMAESAVLLNLGRLAGNLGNVTESRAAYERARDVARRTKQPTVERTATNNLANLLRRMGDVEGALVLHQDTLAMAQTMGSALAEAQALNGIGTDLFRLGRFDEAEGYQRRSLQVRRSLTDLEGQAAALHSLGETLHALGRSEEGLQALREALTIRQQTEDLRAQPGAWSAIAAIERDRGRLPEALAALESALRLVEGLRDNLTSPSLRASFVAGEHAKYELYVDLLMESSRRQGDAALERQAFEAADRGRARTLLEALMTARVDVRRGVDAALLDTEAALQQRVAAASARLSRLLTQAAPPAQVGPARETLTTDSAELERHQARLLRESPDYVSLVRPAPMSLDAVQRELLDSDTVLLEFSLGARRSWLWAVTRDSFETFELPSREAIEPVVRRLRTLYDARVPQHGDTARAHTARVREADAQLPAASAALSTMILASLESRLTGAWRSKRLAIVTADALDFVPLSALPLPATTERLLDRFEIVYLPSASALRAVRQRPAAPRHGQTSVTVLADPVFGASDPRVTRGRPSGSAQEAGGQRAGTPLGRALRSLSANTDGEESLPRLAFSKLEAEAIARLLPPSRVRVVTGFDASRDAVTEGALRSFDIVHLATHGLVSAEEPALTGLVVSLLDREGHARDGFLRLSDIYNLKLDADLVVLSACHTALGKAVRGEGLVGLTRGFMYAGARRVVASLWAVDDSATAELMSRFYQGMLRNGLSPAAALHAAQRQLASRPQWAAPYYWAGFVLQGDWK